MTPRTLTTRDALQERNEQIRNRGYALVSDELELGLTSVAIAIPHPSPRQSLAINLSTTPARVGIDEIETGYVPHLRAASTEERPVGKKGCRNCRAWRSP